MSAIKRVGVLGCGTMGLGIAGACAEAGCDVVLLDLDREICDQALPRLLMGTNPAVQGSESLERIRTGTFDDDMAMLVDCDWICEAVVEDLEIKQTILQRVENHRRPGTFISTNTSGIPLADISRGIPESLLPDIAVTHFFNPVHMMKLVELVPGESTRKEVISTLADFLGSTLGKGVVYAKDTVNFIGNRIGCLWINAGLAHGVRAVTEENISIESVDALLGEPVGLPPTGLFGLVDLVGLDVVVNVNRNLAINLPRGDRAREFLDLPESIAAMAARGQLGRKSGGGFYRLNRHADGSKSMEVYDFRSNDWRPAVEAPSDIVGLDFKTLFGSDSPEGRVVTGIMAETLAYAVSCVPEIADDIVNVDRAMRWGFAWQQGPFELIDLIGGSKFASVLDAQGIPRPPLLDTLMSSGHEHFYLDDGNQFLTISGEYSAIPPG